MIECTANSKHALEGSATLTGNAGLKLKAGFKGSGRCNAQAQIRLPILGWASVLVMPAVRFGLGAALEGEVLLVQGGLGVTGKVGFSPVLGWECNPRCRGLNGVSPVNEFETKSNFPAEHGMEADVSAQFYLLAGLDAAFLGGALSTGLVEARLGPKQSFDLAFEDDQAARTDYAASYDLKLEGVVEPGSGLKKAIEAVIDDDATGVSLSATFSTDLSESPKGRLTASKARVRPDADVDFTVELTPSTLPYFLLGYNVVGVELYRKGEGELKFTPWKSMNMIASNRATYRWTPVEADAGKWEFAAFVNTKVPTPLLEVSPSSITPVEVSCFSGGAPALIRHQSPPTCADTWAGTATVIAKTPGLSTANIATKANITWTYDPSNSGNGVIAYTANGTFELEFNAPGCTVTLSPNTFTITPNPLTPQRLTIATTALSTTYGLVGSQLAPAAVDTAGRGASAVQRCLSVSVYLGFRRSRDGGRSRDRDSVRLRPSRGRGGRAADGPEPAGRALPPDPSRLDRVRHHRQSNRAGRAGLAPLHRRCPGDDGADRWGVDRRE